MFYEITTTRQHLFIKYGLNKVLTSYRQCTGGGGGSYGVGSYTFINSSILLTGLCDLKKLPAIWVGDQVDSVIFL